MSSVTRLVYLTLIALAPLVTISVRADVAPFPSWRVDADGEISQSVQIGSTVFVGGNFTKIGTAVAPFSAMFDPAALTFSPVSGCARSGPHSLEGPFIPVGRTRTPIGTLSDANGPFTPPLDTALVRLGTDCRFDRRFRLALPQGIVLWPELDAEIVATAGRVYIQVSAGTTATSPVYLVEADGASGGILRYWPVDPSTPYRIHGSLPGGRLLATFSGSGQTGGLGWVDPAQGGTFQLRRALPAAWAVHAQAGEAVVLSVFPVDGNPFDTFEITALDPATLAPLPSWPVVRAAPPSPLVASGSGRVFLAGSDLIVDGAPAPRIVTFDAVSGARITSFAPPDWMGPKTTFRSLAVAAGRLIVFADFPPGAPRDTVAALDAASGALDPWTLPWATSFNGGGRVNGLRYFPEVAARDRAARMNLAAVDAKTGQVLPWSADSLRVTALAADAASGYLYVATSRQVRRYDVVTAAIDPLWTFDVAHPTGAATTITGIAAGLGRVYAIGDFSQARDGASAPWQPREAAAAVTLAGALSPWRPALRPACLLGSELRLVLVACVRAVRISQGRVFLQGSLRDVAGALPARSLLAVAADTGAVDPVLPEVPASMVSAIDATSSVLFADAQIGPTRYLASFSVAAGPRLLAPLNPNPGFSLAASGDRLYLDVERDDVSGASTGNPVGWRQPIALLNGVADLVSNSSLSLFVALTPRAPAAPVGVAANLDGSRVTLRWSPGVGDLAPFLGVVAGGSAPTSHVVIASLTAGGPPIARIDTQSADTSLTVAAPTGTFFLHVLATNAFGVSAPSAEVRIDIQPQAPGPPLATVGIVRGRTVRIDWQAPTLGWSASSYVLEAGSSPGLTDLASLPLRATSFETTVPTGRYYVRIRAVNAQGTSAPGDELTIDVS